jgi:DNA-binding Lrp family transcriptional regulator
MKDYEKEIIAHLRKGEKINMSEIARKMNLPITTVIDRIKRIEDKYLVKHSVILDYSKIGYNAPALLAIKANSDKHENLLDFLKLQNNVNAIMRTNSNYSFLVEVVCKNNLELIKWIEETKSRFCMDITPFQILKVEDREKFLP